MQQALAVVTLMETVLSRVSANAGSKPITRQGVRTAHSCTGVLRWQPFLQVSERAMKSSCVLYVRLTANAFVLRGETRLRRYTAGHAELDERLSTAVTERTKAIVPVHYGVGCEMEPLMGIAEEHDCVVIEDALRHHVDPRGHPLGSIGP